MEPRHNAHSVTLLCAHIVFITKYRARVLTSPILESLRLIVANVCEAQDATLIEFNGEEDHCHLLIEYGPTIAVSALVQAIKGTTSFTLGTKWAVGYFAGAVGSNLDDVKKYIQQQERPSAD